MEDDNQPVVEPTEEVREVKAKKEMSKQMMVFVVAVLIALGFAAGYYVGDSYGGGDGAAAETSETAETLEAEELDDADEAAGIDELSAESSESETAGSADEDELDLPVVVFTPAGTFTEAEKTALTTKVVEPLADWYAIEGSTAVSVQINDLIREGMDDTYEYSFDVIFDGGGYSGFLHTEKGEVIDWWRPECLDECVFTVEFTEKYPEVAS